MRRTAWGPAGVPPRFIPQNLLGLEGACRTAPLTTKIDLASAAGGAAQPSSPINHGHRLAAALDQLGKVGIDPLAATLAPNEQPHLRGKRLAEGQRHRLVIASIADHIAIMRRLEITDNECATLIGALRQLVDFDPEPVSPRVQTLRAILERLEPQKPQAIPETASTG